MSEGERRVFVNLLLRTLLTFFPALLNFLLSAVIPSMVSVFVNSNTNMHRTLYFFTIEGKETEKERGRNGWIQRKNVMTARTVKVRRVVARQQQNNEKSVSCHVGRFVREIYIERENREDNINHRVSLSIACKKE